MIVTCVQSGFLDSFPFDPANLNSEVNQVKELKNGRLAMVSSALPNRGCSLYAQACIMPCVTLATTSGAWPHKEGSKLPASIGHARAPGMHSC